MITPEDPPHNVKTVKNQAPFRDRADTAFHASGRPAGPAMDGSSAANNPLIDGLESTTPFRQYPEPSLAYASDSGILLVPGCPNLFARESSQRASSLDDEPRAVRMLEANAIEAGRQDMWPWPKVIRLATGDGNRLGADFCAPRLPYRRSPLRRSRRFQAAGGHGPRPVERTDSPSPEPPSTEDGARRRDPLDSILYI
jgi:hypothetical protein